RHRDFQQWSLVGCCLNQGCRRLSAPKYLNTRGRKPAGFMGTARENCLDSRLGFGTPRRWGICGDFGHPPDPLSGPSLIMTLPSWPASRRLTELWAEHRCPRESPLSTTDTSARSAVRVQLLRSGHKLFSRSHLAWRLSKPSMECVSECA